ncbi:hypothetical protein [Streptomyces vastus]
MRRGRRAQGRTGPPSLVVPESLRRTHDRIGLHEEAAARLLSLN